jgi:arylsulfatase A-like enzyme
MSDNGAFRLNRQGLDVGINDPLRSGGVTCWEGGLRVAALARWPGKIAAGVVIDEPFWSPDLLAACAALAGVPLPRDVALDGKDPLPLLTRGKTSPHDSLFFVYRNHAALRKGDWKIVREHPDHPWQLFHLQEDLSETDNLADQSPDRVRDLTREFGRWQRTFR